MAEYYICAGANKVVGPHAMPLIREWIARRIVGKDWFVYPTNGNRWMRAGDIGGIDMFPRALEQRLESDARERARKPYPATQKQLYKIRYFEIPFIEDGLTISRASEILNCFRLLDPVTEKAYQDRPATDEDMENLRQIGSRPKKPMTHGEAVARLEELRIRRYENNM